MSRSLKKGPYINVKLEKKVLAMNESGKKIVVKTWARASMISPDFVGHTVAVHNGNKFIPVYVACGGNELDGLDFIFTNKILKKFESLNIAFLKDELKKLNSELDKLFGKNTFKMAHNYINDLLRLN